MIKTVVKVIIIVAAVGFCAYYFLAERAERAEIEGVFSGTATYSGTWSTDPSPGRFSLWPKLSGTCKLTVDFDAGTASMSFAGDFSITDKGVLVKSPPGDAYIIEGGRRIKIIIIKGLSGRIEITDPRLRMGIRERGIEECVLLVFGDISSEDPNKAGGSWSVKDEPLRHRLFWRGWWKAQKVPTP